MQYHENFVPIPFNFLDVLILEDHINRCFYVKLFLYSQFDNDPLVILYKIEF